MVDVLLGLQWGDEGKGKIVDHLAPAYDIVARFQGGPNAGHTLIIGGKKFVLHTIPSGIFHDQTENLIGNGVVINPVTLKAEIEGLEEVGLDVRSKLFVSKKAHLILPTHIALDKASEIAKGKEKIGSTLRGIGPTYMDKTGRNGLRIGDLTRKDWKARYDRLKEKHMHMLKSLYGVEYKSDELEDQWLETVELIRNLNLVDSEYWLAQRLAEGKEVLAEGAQGALLDIDFGTYPFVTSSNCTSLGIYPGTGLPGGIVDNSFGVAKLYMSRVGGGPFPTEIHGAEAEAIRNAAGEFGTTTGRPRRIGWLDLVALRHAAAVNGTTGLVLTGLAFLRGVDPVRICTSYEADGRTLAIFPSSSRVLYGVEPVYEELPGFTEDVGSCRSLDELPEAARRLVDRVEEASGFAVRAVCVGKERDQVLPR